MTTQNVILDPCRRGTRFRYSSTLEDGWTSSMFTGGILFTLRTRIPASSVVDDTDAGVVAQVSLADGGIVFSSATAFTVTIPASVTTNWPTKRLVWDMQGIITASPEDDVEDIAAGSVVILGDVTRTQ